MVNLTPLFNAVIWVIPALIVVALLKSSWFKGVFGEFLVKIFALIFLPKDQYHAFHNVTLPTPDGTTQIDHIFVSIFGVFVVETKNMKGWIFGSERQAQWTQKIYKQSFKFQNPLRQNYKHVKALESALNLPSEVFHSVVVFVGDSSFKTAMPANVTYAGEYVAHIRSFQMPVLHPNEVGKAVEAIESGRLVPNFATHKHHVARLKSRSDVESEQRCPRCGSSMILRTANKGSNAGRKFWGCSAFPQCKAVINID